MTKSDERVPQHRSDHGGRRPDDSDGQRRNRDEESKTHPDPEASTRVSGADVWERLTAAAGVREALRKGQTQIDSGDIIPVNELRAEIARRR